MTKITGPAHSDSASGSVADAVTFSTTPTGSVAKRYSRPSALPSAAQTAARSAFRTLMDGYNAAQASDKSTWLTLARSQRTSPTAAFAAYNLVRIRANKLAIARYDRSAESLYNGLRLWCPLDEGQGTDIFNTVSGNAGQLLNADPVAAWSTNPGYLTLDGANDRIQATSPYTPTPAWSATVSLTLNANNPSGTSSFWTVHQAGDAAQAIFCGVHTAGDIFLLYTATAGNNFQRKTTNLLFTGSPHVATITWDGTETYNGCRIYMDGVEASYVNINSGGTLAAPSGTWTFAGRLFDDTRNLAATLDYLCVHDRALSPTEIATLHAQPLVPILIP